MATTDTVASEASCDSDCEMEENGEATEEVDLQAEDEPHNDNKGYRPDDAPAGGAGPSELGGTLCPAPRVPLPHLSSCCASLGNDDQTGSQYSSLYWCRKNQLGALALRAALARWEGRGAGAQVRATTDAGIAANAEDPLDVVVGIVYRRHPKEVLEVRAQCAHPVPLEEARRDVDPSEDWIKLEDPAGRVALRLSERCESSAKRLLMSGLVVAVVGRVSPLDSSVSQTRMHRNDAGTMEVLDVVAPGMPPPLPRSGFGSTTQSQTAPSGVLLLSGVVATADEATEEATDETPETRRMIEYVKEHASSLIRVVVVGGIPLRVAAEADGATGASCPERERRQVMEDERRLRLLDEVLASLGEYVRVDYVPGRLDPTSALLPQPPVHSSLLPKSKRTGNVRMCANPYCETIGGTTVVGESGSALDDLSAQTPTDDDDPFLEEVDDDSSDAREAAHRLSLLERTLEGRHVAPTCPGTLHGRALLQRDVLVLEHLPHVYFSANQRTFAAAQINHSDDRTNAVCTTILVPRLAERGSGVTLCTNTRSCREVEW